MNYGRKQSKVLWGNDDWVISFYFTSFVLKYIINFYAMAKLLGSDHTYIYHVVS